jgi:hypothetical protein
MLGNSAPDQAEALFVPAVVDGSPSGQVRHLADRSTALLSSIDPEIDGIMVRIGRRAPAGTIVAVNVEVSARLGVSQHCLGEPNRINVRSMDSCYPGRALTSELPASATIDRNYRS